MKKTVKRAAAVPGLAKQMKSKLSGEHGILNTLVKEHAEVSALLRLVHAERKRGAHADDEGVITRVRLLTTLTIELLSHARAEEAVFYQALRDLPDAEPRAKQAGEEHKAMERVIYELLSIEYSSPRWLEAYEELMEQVESHVDEEEDEIFALAQQHFSKEVLQEMDERFQAAKDDRRSKLEGRSLSLEGELRTEAQEGHPS